MHKFNFCTKSVPQFFLPNEFQHMWIARGIQTNLARAHDSLRGGCCRDNAHLTSDFAEHIAATDMPVRLRNTPAVKAWRATQTWAFDALLQNITTLTGVKVNRGRCFRYYHRAPMNTVSALVDEYRRITFTKHDMPAQVPVGLTLIPVYTGDKAHSQFVHA